MLLVHLPVGAVYHPTAHTIIRISGVRVPASGRRRLTFLRTQLLQAVPWVGSRRATRHLLHKRAFRGSYTLGAAFLIRQVAHLTVGPIQGSKELHRWLPSPNPPHGR